MDWKNRHSQISNKVKGQLFAKKVQNFSWINKNINQFDPNKTGKLSLHNFNLFLNKVGIFLTTQQLRTIRDKFDYDHEQFIYYIDFIQYIKSDISKKVLSTIKSAFDFLNYNKSGVLQLSYLLSRYQANYHPHSTTRKKSPAEIEQQFKQGISAKSSDKKTLNEKEFLDYYADLNFCIPLEREDFFNELILNTWGMTYGKDYVSSERVQEIQDILYEKVRQKTQEKSSQGKAAKTAFKYFDLADSGQCNLQNFTKALDKFGCKFAPNQIKTLFDKYDTNSSGYITIDEFSQLFSAIGANGPSKIVNPLTTLGKNSIGFNQLKLTK